MTTAKNEQTAAAEENALTEEVEASENLINVQSKLPRDAKSGGYPVAFFERNEAHPGGQAWIADGKTHKVAETNAVLQALKYERLVKVKGGRK